MTFGNGNAIIDESERRDGRLVMAARRTRTLPVATWRGTPAELKALAISVLEVMDAAKQKAAQEAESKAYAKYSEDYAQLEAEFNVSEASSGDQITSESAGQIRNWRTQQLWENTQKAIQMGHAFAEPAIEFSYRLAS